jgi:hypothetical protein
MAQPNPEKTTLDKILRLVDELSPELIDTPAAARWRCRKHLPEFVRKVASVLESESYVGLKLPPSTDDISSFFADDHDSPADF